MRSVTDHKSLAWIGPNPTEWIGAVNPLPSDVVIGSHSLTLINIVNDSHVWIGTQIGSTTIWNKAWGTQDYAYEESSVTYDGVGVNYDSQYDSVIVLPVYKFGSALNDWRIRIRKSTEEPYYRPYETLMTATAGSSSIYISQIPD